MEIIKMNNVTPKLATIFMKYATNHCSPIIILLTGIYSPDTGAFVPFDIRLGSRGDSYYEYLL